MEQERLLQKASEELGNGAETLSASEYNKLTRSRIENDDEESLFVPAPSELSLEQEKFVMEHWSYDVARRCRELEDTTKCAETCREYNPERSKTWYRSADTAKNEIMLAEFHRLTREAAEEASRKAEKGEAQMTGKETEDGWSSKSTETLCAGPSSSATRSQGSRSDQTPTQSTATGSQETRPSFSNHRPSHPQKKGSRSIFEGLRSLFSRKSPKSSFTEWDSMSRVVSKEGYSVRI
jgi:hypothetical protein